MRDALFRAISRYSDFQRSLGVAPNILADRLDGFVRAGLMERRTAEGHPGTQDYCLTEKGRDLAPVIVALTQWGDRWAAPDGPPIIFGHCGCTGMVEQTVRCVACGATVDSADLETRAGPGSHHRGPSGTQRRP